MNFEAIVAITPMTHFPMPCPRSRCSGFTLVEMAVVVTLIGILLAMGLAVANSVMQNTQSSLTKDRQSYVRDALLAYFTANHRLPCPDNGSNVGNTGRDGVEDRTLGGATPTVTAPCTTALGTVPFNTLGIAQEKALDAYGNYMSYRLDIENGWHVTATFPPQTPSPPPPAPPAPFVPCVIPPAGRAVFSTPAPPPPAAAAVVVLISHGPNGRGAWNRGTTNASRNALPTTPEEQGNTVLNPVGPGGYRAYAYSDTAAAPFDDVVLPLLVGDLTTLMVTRLFRRDICN